jgi:cupin 2 domain-containing protein
LAREERVEFNNIFSKIPYFMQDEISETLLKTDDFRLERIISSGQATPFGEWFDQDSNEWVVLLSGSAGLLFEGEEEVRSMHPGDYIHIPAHQRHRVEWTDPGQKTVWLALHYG